MGSWQNESYQMKTQFSKTEADTIKRLLIELQCQDDLSSDIAKQLRNQMREKYGYCIKELNKLLPNANSISGFDYLVENGYIIISKER